MAFFMHRNACHPQASFTPVFRFVGGPERYSRCGGRYHVYRPAPRPWNPRFDVRETEEAYILHGELPGLNKDHVTVEFPEPQKMIVKGRVEREQQQQQQQQEEAPAASQPTAQTDEQEIQEDEKIADDASEDTSSKRSSYQATVEDDDESDDFEMVDSEKKAQEQAEKQLETEAEAEQQQHEQQQEQEGGEPALEGCQRGCAREFSRSFTFPAHVDADFVTADLKDGLLTIVVPKAKHVTHKVTIN